MARKPHPLGAISRTRYFSTMAPLSNQRHEAFCRLVSKGEAASRAYSSVYRVSGHTAEVNGSKLLRNTELVARINELQGAAAKRSEKTIESLVEQLDEIIEFARRCKQPAVMVSAVNSQARLLGLMVDKSEVSVLHKPALIPTRLIELSEEEWIAQFSKGTGSLPALTGGAKRLKAEKRRLNGHAHPKPAAAVFDGDEEAAVPNMGVIDLG